MSRDIIKEYKLNNGQKRYMFQVYTGINPLTGKRSQTTKRGFKTKSQAKLALKNIQAKVADGTYWINEKENKQLTFKEVAEEFIQSKQATYKISTITTYTSYLNTLANIHNIFIDKLTVNELNKELQTFKNNSNKHINSITTFLKSVFDYAVMHDYIKKDITKLIEKPINHNVKEKVENFYTEEELYIYLDRAKEYNDLLYNLSYVLAFTGMRISEALALTWDDIDFENKTININKTIIRSKAKTYVQTPKTKNSIRKISIDDKTIAVLKNIKSTNNKENVFINSNGKAALAHSLSISLKRFFEKNKDLKVITFHGFRHTHASLLFKYGVNIKVVQKRLGHSSFNTTMDIYTHVTELDENKALDNYFKNIS